MKYFYDMLNLNDVKYLHVTTYINYTHIYVAVAHILITWDASTTKATSKTKVKPT